MDCSYKCSCYGVDWLNRLQRCYGVDHWCFVVDVDEFFVYLFCDMRFLFVLIDWLDVLVIWLFGAMLLDMYLKGLLDA